MMPDASPQPQVFQTGWIDLLPRVFGWTFAMLVWFALQALAWMLMVLFKVDWPGIAAAILGAALLPHFISSLVALVFPSRRRLVLDQTGIVCTLGMTRYAASWEQCGTFTLNRSTLRRPILRISGEMSVCPFLWRILEWPLYAVIWLVTVMIATLASSMASAAIDFPGTEDRSRISSLFHRGENLDRLLVVLGPRLAPS